MNVREAETEGDLQQARRLLRSCLTWYRDRHAGDPDLVDAYADLPAFERELARLSGGYNPPDGALLLCWDAEIALGCGGFQRIDTERCELKRLFVAPTARRTGAGRALLSALIGRATEAGYREMSLEASLLQQEAIVLCRALGFTQDPPSHGVPEAQQGRLVSLRRDL